MAHLAGLAPGGAETALAEALTAELDSGALDDLTERMQGAEASAPTRPHPYAPHTGVAGQVSRRVMHAVDAFWDATEGRIVPREGVARPREAGPVSSTSSRIPASTRTSRRRAREARALARVASPTPICWSNVTVPGAMRGSLGCRHEGPACPGRQCHDECRGAGRAEDQIAAAEVAMAAVAGLLAQGVEVVITHGNGPQVGNLLVKNELAAAVVPPVPLDWCGAQTQATLGLTLMDALDCGSPDEASCVRPRRVVTRALVDGDDPGFTSRPSRSGGTCPPTRPPADRARRGVGGPRPEGLAPRGRVAGAAARSSTPRRSWRCSTPASWSSRLAAAASRSYATARAT